MVASESSGQVAGDAELLAVARQAIAGALTGGRGVTSGADATEEPHGGIFVTLWAPGHRLRGCIGHLTSLEPTVADEVASCAVASATADPRFPVVEPEELVDLVIELSLLGPLEAVAGYEALDPRRFGVVVTQGARRGVLLPGIEGVDTVAEQVAIAAQKGRIDLGRPFQLYRFEARKAAEPAGALAVQDLRP